jgi:hypothetical protein
VTEFAREVTQFLRDAGVDLETFLKELSRMNPGGSAKGAAKKASPRS